MHNIHLCISNFSVKLNHLLIQKLFQKPYCNFRQIDGFFIKLQNTQCGKMKNLLSRSVTQNNFCQINSLVFSLFSKTLLSKSVTVNFRNFHTVKHFNLVFTSTWRILLFSVVSRKITGFCNGFSFSSLSCLCSKSIQKYDFKHCVVDLLNFPYG